MAPEHRLAFRALELLESPRVVRRVERALRFGGARSRGDALEVLSNLGDRDAARLLVLMHEPGRSRSAWPARCGRDAPCEPRARSSPRRAAPRTAGCAWRWRRATGGGRDSAAESAVMERLLALKRVPLFENLNLDQLEAVLRLAATPPSCRRSDRASGDPGGELYLVLEGSVEAWLDHGGANPQQLSTMPAGSYFGEMAILDDEPRSATVVARERARLLTLDGDSLKELLMQMPEIAFELCA
jgi:hypothetical protein